MLLNRHVLWTVDNDTSVSGSNNAIFGIPGHYMEELDTSLNSKSSYFRLFYFML